MGILRVVIATYNRRSTLIEAIESALSLSVPVGWRREIVVVDDGGTDGSFELIEKKFELKKISDQISTGLEIAALRTKNRERGAARNSGVAFSDGERFSSADWYLFLDSDDRLTEDAFLRFTQAVERDQSLGKTSADLVFGRIALWNGLTSPLLKDISSVPVPGDFAEQSLVETFVPLGASFVSHGLFVRLGGFPEPRELAGSEDKIFLTRALFWGRAQFVSSVMTWYRQHPLNTPIETMNRSIDSAEIELKADILKRFADETPTQKLRSFTRQNALKKIGHAVHLKRIDWATTEIRNLFRKDAMAVFTIGFLRIAASFLKSQLKLN